MISVIEADADHFLRTRYGRTKLDIRSIEQKCLNAAGRALQLSQLFLEQGESVFYVKRVFNRKCYSWKLQKVVANCFRDIETGFAENAAEAYDIRRIFSRKIHEFHRSLL